MAVGPIVTPKTDKERKSTKFLYKEIKVRSVSKLKYYSRQQDRDKYNRLVSSQANIDSFVRSVLDFLSKHKFDGLDVDWEYPRNGVDKVGYINLMSSLKKALEPNYLLSAAIPAGRWALEDGT